MRTLALGLNLLLLAGSARAAGWTELAPGGDTLCARGAPFSFFVQDGDPAKVIVDFIGGGACWDATTCAPETATFTDTVDSVRGIGSTGMAQGVYDAGNAANPYGGWTHVVVPYCTGDVHWGHADQTYTRADGTSFVIHHRGATNAKAVLAYVKEKYAAAAKLFVTGCSAGAYGAVYWTPHLKRDFPAAAVREFGDSGAGVQTPSFMEAGLPLWNVTENAPAWIPALDPASNDWQHMQLTDMYERAAAFYPDVVFSQYNSDHDFIQTLFYQFMGGEAADWSPLMRANVARLEAGTPNFRGFNAETELHCATVDNQFYGLKGHDGTRVRDWVDQLANGAVPDSVK